MNDQDNEFSETLKTAVDDIVDTGGGTINITVPSSSNIGPNIAKGIAIAQTAVHTTGFDRENTFSRYKYTGLGTIFAMARHACQQGQLSFRIGRTWVDQSGPVAMLYGIVHVSHVSGECLPDYETSMAIVPGKKPFDKGLLVARTVMRRYAVCDFLGMGWDEAGDDIDQRNDDEYTVPPKINLPDHSQTDFSGKSGASREAIEKHERTQLARTALTNLKEMLGKESTNEMVYAMALGMSEIPSPPTNEVLIGLIDAWNVCLRFESISDVPESHDDLIIAANEMSTPLRWNHGQHTSAAD